MGFIQALGAFLANSESQDADVECFASPSDQTPIDGGCTFRTEKRLDLLSDSVAVSTGAYHAQYRVLEAFSLFNVILGTFSFTLDPVLVKLT
jgi:hypothetical protein